MTKQSMIDKIYEKIADKNVSLWCYIKENRSQLIGRYVKKHIGCKIERNQVILNWYDLCNFSEYDTIGHPVMIWDILDYIENEWSYLTEYYDWNNLTYKAADTLTYWNEKRKPIEDQPEDAIRFIYDLISSNQ